MNSNDYLQDYSFLKELDNERIKVYYVKIIVLTLDELPIRAIEGRVGIGSSISIAANSAVRRTCSLNFVAEDSDNDLSDILINRNEFSGFQMPGTGTHSGGIQVITPKKPSSTRKYLCPCCGNSVRATKVVRIGCLDCGAQMLEV